MTIPLSLEKQLRAAVRTWGVKYAAWITLVEDSKWNVEGGAGLTMRRRKALQTLLSRQTIRDWLKGALVSGRTRSRKTPAGLQSELGERVTALPARSGILIFGGAVNAEVRQAFRIIAAGAEDIVMHHVFTERLRGRRYCEQMETLFSASPLNLEGIAKAALESLRIMGMPFRRACLAIVEGKSLRIVHAVGDENSASLKGYSIRWDRVPQLRNMFSNPNSEIYQFPSCPLRPKTSESHGCIGAPIFWHSYPVAMLGVESAGVFDPEGEALLLRPFLFFLRWMLECVLFSDEASERLRWKTRWEEVLFTALVSKDFGEAVQRVKQRLRVIYGADAVRVLLAANDDDHLVDQGDGKTSISVPLRGSVSGFVYRQGEPMVLGSPEEAPEGIEIVKGFNSELAVPLKVEGRVVGVIDIASQKPRAFEDDDKRHLQALASQLGLLLEKMRLQEETRRRAENLSLMHQIITELIKQTDEDSIARITAERLAERFGFELTMVLFVDPATGEITGKYAAGLGGVYVALRSERGSWYLPHGVIDKVLSTGRALLINDTDHCSLYRFAVFHGLSELCVPILREDGTAIGVINVEHTRRNAFTEEDKVLLESVAGVLSAVLSSARRYQSLMVNLHQLEAVRAIGADISADLDLDTMLQRIVRRVVELLGVQGADIALLSPDAENLKVVAVENPWYDYIGFSFGVGEGVSGRAAMERKAVLSNNYPFWQDRGLPKSKLPAASAMAVPMMHQDSVIGVLTVYDGRGDFSFGDKERRLLELVMPQITAAVRNAMMYHEIQVRIDAQRTAEEQLLRSARLAAIGELASGVAHELNNPLTNVAGFLELALETLPPDLPERDDLDVALNEARRAANIVRNLLNFAHGYSSTKVAVNVDDLITEALSLVSHLLHRHGIFLNRITADQPPLAEINPIEINQVILNLIINAVEAMPNGGTLTLSTSFEEEDGKHWVVVRVQDTGRGISAENLRRIFEPLFTTKPTGMGMGLAVSYSAVVRNGGTINVESEVGKGATFIIKLPMFLPE